MTFIAYNDTAVGGTVHVIARAWRDAAHAIPANAPTGSTILEASKDVPRDVGDAAIGMYVDISTGAVVAGPPAINTVQSQRDEIYNIIRTDFLARFNASLFDAARATMVRNYARMVIAYAKHATTSVDLDAIKTVARTNPNEFALYAQASTWTFAAAGLFSFQKPDVLTPDSVALPAAETLAVVVTIQQIQAINVAQELS